MKRCYSGLAIILALAMLPACDTVVKPSTDFEKLDIVMLGTYGYTTIEEAGRTIEHYDPGIEYDDTKMPDTQAGFRMVLPIQFYNQGPQTWYDSRANLFIRVTAPDGVETSFILPFSDAMVQRRRTEGDSQYLIKDKAALLERRLITGDRKVFFFDTPFIPMKLGVYSILVELRSKGLIKMRMSRSAFTVFVSEASGGVTSTPRICSLAAACSASETCCSGGIDVPLERRQGHCASSCQSDEIEIAYAIASS